MTVVDKTWSDRIRNFLKFLIRWTIEWNCELQPDSVDSDGAMEQNPESMKRDPNRGGIRLSWEDNMESLLQKRRFWHQRLAKDRPKLISIRRISTSPGRIWLDLAFELTSPCSIMMKMHTVMKWNNGNVRLFNAISSEGGMLKLDLEQMRKFRGCMGGYCKWN